MTIFTKPQSQQDVFVLVNEKNMVLTFINEWYVEKGNHCRKLKHSLILEKMSNINITDIDFTCVYTRPNMLLKALKARYPAKLFNGFKEKRVTITKNVTYTLHD